MFSLLPGEARKVASQLRSPRMKLDQFVENLKEKLLFDHNIQQRKIADWNGVTFKRFHQATSTTRKATTDCIKNMFAHFEDLPNYMSNDNLVIRTSLRYIQKRKLVQKPESL